MIDAHPQLSDALSSISASAPALSTALAAPPLTLGAWLHTLSPFALRLDSGIGLHWYGLAYAAGFIIAWMLMRWLARRGATPIPEHRVGDAMLLLVTGVIVGGRAGYVLIYDRALLSEFSSSFPWWGALAVNKGGMAFHGALVGLMLAGWFVARGFKDEHGVRVGASPWRHVMDLLAFSGTIGLGLGRVANFVNGELLGKIVAQPGEPAPWWSVQFPQELLNDHKDVVLSAPQVHELNAILTTYAPRAQDQWSATSTLVTLLQGGGETARTLSTRLSPLLSSRHPSQLYQAFFEGIVLTAIVWFVWRVPRKPGVVGCWFLIAYGVLRVLAEFFRLPDAQFAEGRPLGLSRGQWLSAAMVALGIAVLAWVRKRNEPTLGGWARRGALGAEQAS